MTINEAIVYGKRWDEAIVSRGETSNSNARLFLQTAIMALENMKNHPDNDYFTHKMIICPQCGYYLIEDLVKEDDG